MSTKIDPRHPILTQEYAIYTPPIDKMITTIGDWIVNQRSIFSSFSMVLSAIKSVRFYKTIRKKFLLVNLDAVF